MSTEHDYTVGSEQYLWLEADLAGVNRTITPWIIFGGHRAMYLNINYVDGVTSDC
jgi:acid phosphatase type 7